MSDGKSLIIFKAICNFVNDLGEAFASRHKPLKLYRRLINQTQIAHETAIQKHIIACHTFCITNRDAIVECDVKKLVDSKILYSQRVFIDMNEIFKISDRETTPIIWKHILTISALVDPQGNAKEVLQKEGDSSKESEFLNSIISKVENVNTNSNPMEAITSLMQSGMNGGGNLDIGKLIGVVQGMIANLNQQAGDNPEAAPAIAMINSMSSMVTNMGNGAEPDMAGMMQMMSGMMSGMNLQK